MKDDKLQSDELNHPLNDAQKARKLFFDEVNAFSELSPNLGQIYYGLLNQFEEFKGFFAYIGSQQRTRCPPEKCIFAREKAPPTKILHRPLEKKKVDLSKRINYTEREAGMRTSAAGPFNENDAREGLP